MKVCHLSVLHYRFDTRILVKQCASLHRAGHEVHFLVADGLGSETSNGIQIHDAGLRPRMLRRITTFQRQFLKKALAIDARVYHFHDPELMRLGLQLKRQGKKVIMDVHEDVPRQILGEKSNFRNNVISKLIESLEKYTSPRFDAVITASPIVKKRFEQYGGRVENISNFPALTNFPVATVKKKYDLVYVGSISALRGIRETLLAIEGTDISYALAGDFQGANFEKSLRELPAWRENTTYLGFIEEIGTISKLLSQSHIGMNNLLPYPSFPTAISVKMFEYMAAGIPQISTNFPFWQSIIDKHQCGICIDSEDPASLKKGIQRLLQDKATARKMGENGRRAIMKHYNWTQEEAKLLNLYQTL